MNPILRLLLSIAQNSCTSFLDAGNPIIACQGDRGDTVRNNISPLPNSWPIFYAIQRDADKPGKSYWEGWI